MDRGLDPRATQATTDFYAKAPGLRWVRWALGTAERLWPGAAVRAATRLFGTPLPLRARRRARPWPNGWQAERWAFERAGLTLHTGDAPGECVLLVHGWGGNARQMLPLADVLAQRGLRPVLLDLPAHGESAGRTSNLPQFARAIDYVCARLAERGQPPRAVVAHSLAANALAQAAARGLQVPRLVLVAPPASPHLYTHLFAQAFGLSEHTRAGLQRRVEAREGIVMAQFEPAAVGPRIAVPALVVHDEDDRINPFADGLAFRRELAHGQLLATRGLGHQRVLKDAAVLEQMADFISR